MLREDVAIAHDSRLIEAKQLIMYSNMSAQCRGCHTVTKLRDSGGHSELRFLKRMISGPASGGLRSEISTGPEEFPEITT
jgi:hypothetical protein